MNQQIFTRTTFRLSLSCATVLGGALFLGAGCGKDDPVRVYDVQPKDRETALPTEAADAVAASPIDWTIPAGWTKEPPRQIIFASFKIDPTDPKSECTVSRLPAGQPLLANINRWEGQLHLPNSSEESLRTLLKDQTLPAGRAGRIDLIAPEPAAGDSTPRQRMVVVILPHGQDWWFLKLVGRADIVEKQLASFDEFLQSIHFSGGEPADEGPAVPPVSPGAPPPDDPLHGGMSPQHADMPATAPASPALKISNWSTPAGWTQDPSPADPAGMRRLSFHVANGDKPGIVTVTCLPGVSMDQLGSFVNMWRDQVGLPASGAANGNDATPVTVANRSGLLYDFTGPQSDNAQKRVVIALVLVANDGWFFKFAGPPDLVGGQKPAFLDFLKSLDLTPH